MKVTFKYLAAPVILIAGAVLFLNCSDISGARNAMLLPVKNNTVVLTASEYLCDSIRPLGKTGYEIVLQKDYFFQVTDDSTFKIYPRPDTGCMSSVYLKFRKTPMKVPGTRSVRSAGAVVLGQQITLREIRYPGYYCIYRSGSVKIDSLYLQIEGNAPPDQRIEKLFGVAFTLRKTP